MKKCYIIYHSRDLDGVCSGAIANMALEDDYETVLIGWDYGQPIPEVPKGSKVVMLDISFPKEVMIEWNDKMDLTWIDHHITKIEELQGVPIKGRQEEGLAACELAWMWFFHSDSMPPGVEMLGVYDTWRKDSIDFDWEKEVLPFQFGMRALPLDPEKLQLSRMIEFGGLYCDAVIQGGREWILPYIDEYNGKIARDKSFETVINDWNVICLNTNFSNSGAFKGIYDPKRHDAMLVFSYNGDHWTVSMYSTKEEINVGEFCKSMGGGGHKNAAGFQIYDISEIGL